MKLKLQKKAEKKQRKKWVDQENFTDNIPDPPNFRRKETKNNHNIKSPKTYKNKRSLLKKMLIWGSGVSIAMMIFMKLISGVGIGDADIKSDNYHKHLEMPSNEIVLSLNDIDKRKHPNISILSSEEKQKRLAKKEETFYTLSLFDSCDQDGDVVAVRSNGVEITQVLLTNAGQTVSIPLAPSGGNIIEIYGAKDGGGGITVAFKTSYGDFYSKIINPGESIPVALKVK